ncbi:hypothetical protein D3C80_1318980 [compost metagenome]
MGRNMCCNRTSENARSRLNQHGLLTERYGAMRHFKANKTTTDNHNILHIRHHICYAARIIQATECDNTVKLDTWDIRNPRARTRGEYQFRPGKDAFIVKSDGFVSQRNAIHATAENHLNIIIAIGVFRAKHQNTAFRSFQIGFG